MLLCYFQVVLLLFTTQRGVPVGCLSTALLYVLCSSMLFCCYLQLNAGYLLVACQQLFPMFSVVQCCFVVFSCILLFTTQHGVPVGCQSTALLYVLCSSMLLCCFHVVLLLFTTQRGVPVGCLSAALPQWPGASQS